MAKAKTLSLNDSTRASDSSPRRDRRGTGGEPEASRRGIIRAARVESRQVGGRAGEQPSGGAATGWPPGGAAASWPPGGAAASWPPGGAAASGPQAGQQPGWPPGGRSGSTASAGLPGSALTVRNAAAISARPVPAASRTCSRIRAFSGSRNPAPIRPRPSSSAPTASSPGTAASSSAPVRRGATPPSAAVELSAGRARPGAEVLAIVPPSVNSATLMITIVSGAGAPPPVEGTRAAGCPLVLAV